MTFTRRSFLAWAAGALGAGQLLAACGNSSSESDGSVPEDPAGSGPISSGFTVVPRFPNTALTPGDQRLAISLADDSATLQVTGPAELRGRIVDDTGAEISTFVAPIHDDGIEIAYWSVTAALAAPGIYALEVEGATGMPTAFQLFDPAAVSIPSPGAALPAFDTPTVADARGVDPICTLTPDPCPFHAVTLTDALAVGLPVVYLIGTPAFCTTGTCAPGLEFLVGAAGAYEGKATFVHAEVYADNAGTTVAPAVTAIGAEYEPLLFITDADGIVRERLDVVWDGADLSAALARWIS